MFTPIQLNVLKRLIDNDAWIGDTYIPVCARHNIVIAYIDYTCVTANSLNWKYSNSYIFDTEINFFILNDYITVEVLNDNINIVRNEVNRILKKFCIDKVIKNDKGKLIVLNDDSAYVEGIRYEPYSKYTSFPLPLKNTVDGNIVIKSANCLDCNYYVGNKFLHCTASPNGYLQTGCTYERN